MSTTFFECSRRNATRGVEETILFEKVCGFEVDISRVDEGCGGVYLAQSSGESLAVFKPSDEEAHAETMPAYVGADREVTAYKLDQMYAGFSKIPVCTFAAMKTTSGEEKWGALQSFVSHEDSAENFGSALMPIQDVQRIGIFDIRIFNMDRHFGNILVGKKDGMVHLTPIDHGASLPSCFDLGKARFEWLQWKQSKAAFTEESLSHIESLEPEKDAELLGSLGIDQECIVSLVLGTKTLKLGARNGLTLWDIGNSIQRELGSDSPSVLEKAIAKVVGEHATAARILAQSTAIVEEVVSQVSAKPGLQIPVPRMGLDATRGNFRRSGPSSQYSVSNPASIRLSLSPTQNGGQPSNHGNSNQRPCNGTVITLVFSMFPREQNEESVRNLGGDYLFSVLFSFA